MGVKIPILCDMLEIAMLIQDSSLPSLDEIWYQHENSISVYCYAQSDMKFRSLLCLNNTCFTSMYCKVSSNISVCMSLFCLTK